MARVKHTAAPRQSKDDTTLEVVDASAHDAAEVSSRFNQDLVKDVPIQGCEDRVNSKMEAEDGDDEGDTESSEGESFGFESDARRKVARAVAAATTGLTFEYCTSTIMKGRFHVMEDLGYFAKGYGTAPG
jgi:hypothetical protein